MYLDAFTLSAMVDEFMDVLVGGRIQDTLSVNDQGLGFEVYSFVDHRRLYLYLSADMQIPRVHLVDDRLRRGLATPTQLGLLVRRYVENGTVLHVSQPPWERILQIDVEGPEGEVTLIVEPMERRSNILLVQRGVIIDCMRRVGPEDNRYRLSLPNHQYVLPPPQTDKLNPLLISSAELALLFARSTDPKRKAFQVLSGGILGVSPLLAKEVVFRAQGDAALKATAANPEALVTALHALVKPLGNREWQPGVAETDGVVEAYSVYPLQHLAGWHPVSSISAGVAAYYGEPTGEEAYTAAKKPVLAAIDEAKAKLSAKLASLGRSMTDDSDREILRHSGELILAYQYSLQPGQTELRAQYEPDEPELVIPLNPKQTPLENAQTYFTRYNKAKKALDDVPRLIKQTQHTLDYLAQLAMDLTCSPAGRIRVSWMMPSGINGRQSLAQLSSLSSEKSCAAQPQVESPGSRSAGG
ncbi:MAG: NFACT family protein, partial [Armatimonadetes bacterium]|nr:NFACT family protein [Anaerolineae bacterium]